MKFTAGVFYTTKNVRLERESGKERKSQCVPRTNSGGCFNCQLYAQTRQGGVCEVEEAAPSPSASEVGREYLLPQCLCSLVGVTNFLNTMVFLSTFFSVNGSLAPGRVYKEPQLFRFAFWAGFSRSR